MSTEKPRHEFKPAGIGDLDLWCKRCGLWWDLDQRTGMYTPYSFDPNTGAYDRMVGLPVKRPRHLHNYPDTVGAVSFGPAMPEISRREFIQAMNRGEIFAVPPVKPEELR